ncbi:isopentenyl phosphate kinase [Halomarina litorea]|uniref:isopentenyl phosphate kinase n=1 Tax=Halomarina litorea TaxID=2961595 RepID=UPI0034A1CA2B
MTVLKLGGSIVTDKDSPETLAKHAIAHAAMAIAGYVEAEADNDLVLVHGGGSFGHFHASEHDVTPTEGSRDGAAVLAIHEAMQELNEAVVGALADEKVPALPVHPLSAARRSAEGDLSLPLETTATMVEEGFVPVLHGDVVVHEGAGATILSGDELVVELARGLDADRVGLCSAVPGVLDEAGSVVRRIQAFEDVESVLGASESTDVTGGMAAKVQELLDLEMPASIFAVDDLGPFLAGDAVGTRID